MCKRLLTHVEIIPRNYVATGQQDGFKIKIKKQLLSPILSNV